MYRSLNYHIFRRVCHPSPLLDNASLLPGVIKNKSPTVNESPLVAEEESNSSGILT